ncbi:hypothetical protein GCM10017673_57250 [Streptosporangium violaceochromogenes]|nr:hypothetical protein GCM10017673_57250 [Streptosporangium violaceochromogenes]
MRASRVPARRLSVLAATLLATAALTAATPAQADDAGSTSARADEAGAVLAIARHNLYEGTVRHWYLTCDPDGGSHPDPHGACDRLRDIDGDLDRLRFRPDVACPRIYAPVRVKITGTWYGEFKVFSEKYPNACYAEQLAGPVVPD